MYFSQLLCTKPTNPFSQVAFSPHTDERLCVWLTELANYAVEGKTMDFFTNITTGELFRPIGATPALTTVTSALMWTTPVIRVAMNAARDRKRRRAKREQTYDREDYGWYTAFQRIRKNNIAVVCNILYVGSLFISKTPFFRDVALTISKLAFVAVRFWCKSNPG